MPSTLLRLRKASGYRTARSFAEAVGIPPTTYADYEAQPTRIPIERALLIADRLGCSLDEVYGRCEPGRGDAAARGVAARYEGLSRRSRRDAAEFIEYLARRDERTGQVAREREEARWDGIESGYESSFVSSLLAGGPTGGAGGPREAFRSFVASMESGEGADVRVGKVMAAFDRRHGGARVAAEFDGAAYREGGDASGRQ